MKVVEDVSQNTMTPKVVEILPHKVFCYTPFHTQARTLSLWTPVECFHFTAWSSPSQLLSVSQAFATVLEVILSAPISDLVAGRGEEHWDQSVWFHHTFPFLLSLHAEVCVQVGCRWEEMCEGDRAKCTFFSRCFFFFLYTCRPFFFPLRTGLTSLGSVPWREE